MTSKIEQIICSVKSCSLLLLRYKSLNNPDQSNLTIFYMKDYEENPSIEQWTVLEGLNQHQRVFQVSLSQKLNVDQTKNTKIGVYNELNREVIIYELVKK